MKMKTPTRRPLAALKSTNQAALLILLLQASNNHNNNHLFVQGLVEPTTDAKIGTVAENEHIDPSLSAIQNGPTFLPFDTLPSLLNNNNGNAPDPDLPRNENPFGPSGTSIHQGLGLGPRGNNGGNGRKIAVDARSGRPASLDFAKPLIPGNGVGNSLLWSVGVDNTNGDDGNGSHGHGGPPKSHKEIETISRSAIQNWFHTNQDLLQINSQNELFPPQQPGRTRMAVHGPSGETIQVSAQRTFQGIEVKGSRASATIKKGNLINVGLESWGDIPNDFSTEPSITVEEAMEAVAEHAGRELVEDKENCKSELLILPMVVSSESSSSSVRENLFSQLRGGGGGGGQANNGNNNQGTTNTDEYYDHKLVWKVCPVLQGQAQEIMEAHVDAHTAHIYSFKDTVDYLNNAEGSVYPLSNDGIGVDGIVYEGWPMPWMEVGSTITTTGGNYEGDGSMTGRFYGPYVNMADNCGTDSLTQSGGLDWGNSGGTDCTTPGYGGAGNTHSSRSGFYELNKMMEIARSRLPNNSWLTQRLTANMNINNSCNAFWNGSTINFYRSGGGCANTGEIAAIFDHEWGHGMDANDVRGGIASPSGEGIADLYAALRLGDPCIGRGFRGSVCTNGGRCKTCTGVRTIDYMGREREVPYTLTLMKAECASNNVHCVGIVYAEAVWDLYKRFLQDDPYFYDDNTALEIVTRLTYIAAGNIGTWFSYNGGVNSACNADSGYYQYLQADDDDGDLNNGTPHMTAIWNAFASHEIACSDNESPDVQDSGCVGNPTSAPQVTVQPGNAENFITWTSVTGAIEYEVLRTEGVHNCAQGKVLLTTTPALSFTDTGLQNDRDYYYIVVPKGTSDSCYGPSSMCESAKPVSGPSMSVYCPNDPVTFNPNAVPATDSRTCTVEGSGGWSGIVELGCSASGTFSGITCAVSTSSVSIDNNSADITLNINAGLSTSVGEGVVELTADGGDIVRSFTANVKVFKPPQMAVYDASIEIPKCAAFGSSCDSGSLLLGRGNKGPEPNTPNLINGPNNCDGGSGTYQSDESLERLVVRSLDGDDMYEGSTIEIVATVWAWSTGSSDYLDLYYTNNPSNPDWQTIITSVKPPGGGQQDITAQVQLMPGLNHAIRGNFRYNGAANLPCSGGSYDDADDLFFTVKALVVDTEAPTAVPSASPSESMVPSAKPTGESSNAPSESLGPSSKPSLTSSASPSSSRVPSESPSQGPSGAPSFSPSKTPTSYPSFSPTKEPSSKPSLTPSASPSSSQIPSKSPSKGPSGAPSSSPSKTPTFYPSFSPTKAPVRQCVAKKESCGSDVECCSNNCNLKKGSCK